MKTKMLVLAALVGASALSAQAGVGFNIGIGLPFVVTPPVVVAAPCPPPAPPVIVETVPAVPARLCLDWRILVLSATGYVWCMVVGIIVPPMSCAALLWRRLRRPSW